MKKRFLAGTVILALLLALVTSACGASPRKNAMPSSAPAMSSSAAVADAAMEEAGVERAAQGMDGGGESAPPPADHSRKLIRTVHLNVETKEFDVLSAAVTEQIIALGGYVESSNVEGGSKDYGSYRPRSSHLIVRIPKEKVDSFIGKVGELGNITTRSENTEDVTLQYVDVDSHKKALAIEQERLLALLEKAEKIEDIIALEERLSNVRYELQSYESQLRTFDNQIDYSTVTLHIDEVERITPQEEKTVWNRMTSGLSRSFFNIGEGAKNFSVWFVVNLPYLFIWAVIIAVLVWILRKVVRKQRIKKQERIAQWNNRVAAQNAAPKDDSKGK